MPTRRVFEIRRAVELGDHAVAPSSVALELLRLSTGETELVTLPYDQLAVGWQHVQAPADLVGAVCTWEYPGPRMITWHGSTATQIVADLSEPPELYTALDAVPAELWTGDYRWTNQMGQVCLVERKTINDLMSSLRRERSDQDSRLTSQLKKMSTQGDIRILFLEGVPYAKEMPDGLISTLNKVHGWQWGTVMTMLMSVQAVYGMYVFVGSNSRHTPRHIQAIRQWTDRLVHRSVSSGTGQGQDSAPVGPQALALMSLMKDVRGFGLKRAQALITHYGTLRKVLDATEADLLTIDGIGPVLATGIRQVLEKV